jgi:calpain-15
VVLDNFMPTIDNKLIFSRAHGKETWVIILEKAWAKIHGSYERIQEGLTEHAVRDLTGAPGETLAFNL